MTKMNTTNPPDLDSHPYGVDVIRKVYSVFLIIIFLFGMVGNSLTIVVLRTKRLRQSSTAVYLVALAIVDMLYLLASLLINIINFTILFPRDLRHGSAIACRLSPFLNYTLAYLSVWLMVAVTVDRAIWVVRPFRAKLVCTQRNAAITICTLALILIGLDSHFFWTMNYTQSTQRPDIFQCVPSHFTRVIFPYIDLVLICCLPFLFMLAANILIGWQLKRMRDFSRRRRTTSSRSDGPCPPTQPCILTPSDEFPLGVFITKDINTGIQPSRKQQRKQRRYEMKDSIKMKSSAEKSSSLTTMLVAISVFFMVSVLPLMIYDVVYFAVDLSKWIENEEPWRVTILVAVERIVYSLWYTNFAVHFILYCLNGPPFRAKVLSMFRPTSCYNTDHNSNRDLVEPNRTENDCTQSNKSPGSTQTADQTKRPVLNGFRFNVKSFQRAIHSIKLLDSDKMSLNGKFQGQPVMSQQPCGSSSGAKPSQTNMIIPVIKIIENSTET